MKKLIKILNSTLIVSIVILLLNYFIQALGESYAASHREGYDIVHNRILDKGLEEVCGIIQTFFLASIGCCITIIVIIMLIRKFKKN